MSIANAGKTHSFSVHHPYRGMVSASAAVYAEYEPETSLYFKRPPPPFTSDTMVGTKLGQFRIWSDDGNIYTPVITLSPDVASPPIKMTGLFSWNHPNDPEERDLTFHVIFLAYREGNNPGYISQSWSEPRVAVAGNIANARYLRPAVSCRYFSHQYQCRHQFERWNPCNSQSWQPRKRVFPEHSLCIQKPVQPLL